MGIRTQRIQARLLETPKLTMERTLKIAISMEKAEEGIHQLKLEKGSDGAEQVDYVGSTSRSKKKTNEKPFQKGNRPGGRKVQPKKMQTSKEANRVRNSKRHVDGKFVCYRCGGNHLAPSCTLPRDIKCNGCGGHGHLQKVCRNKGQTHLQLLVKDIATVEKIDEHTNLRALFAVSLNIESIKVRFNIDCDAAVTLVNK